MNLSELKTELLKDPKFRAEYNKYDLAFEISQSVLDLRVRHGLTQAKLARKIGTHQPAIARIENGNRLPALSFLEKIAKACGEEIQLTFYAKIAREYNKKRQRKYRLSKKDKTL